MMSAARARLRNYGHFELDSSPQVLLPLEPIATRRFEKSSLEVDSTGTSARKSATDDQPSRVLNSTLRGSCTVETTRYPPYSATQPLSPSILASAT
jgi:hypothetical protein